MAIDRTSVQATLNSFQANKPHTTRRSYTREFKLKGICFFSVIVIDVSDIKKIFTQHEDNRRQYDGLKDHFRLEGWQILPRSSFHIHATLHWHHDTLNTRIQNETHTTK